MIKKLIGFVAAAAVIAVIVLTVMRSGEYRSMLDLGTTTPAVVEVPVKPQPVVTEVPSGVDSVAVQRADSL